MSGPRRRSLGPTRRAGRVFAALLALSLLVPACRGKESEAVSVARTFAETARRGDVEGMMAVLERPAIERLEETAERASDQVGGRRSIESSEMLQIVGVDRSVAVAEAELLDDDGSVAHVELTMTDGERIRLELVWETREGEGEDGDDGGGAWKVRIPLPRQTGPDDASVAPVPSDPGA